MDLNSFGLWLHGWTELNGEKIPTEEQWKMIVEHLNLCFNKVTKPLEGNDEKIEPIDFEKDQSLKDIIEKLKKKEWVNPPSPYQAPPFVLPNPYDGKPNPLYPEPNIICTTSPNGLNVKLCNKVNLDSIFPKDDLSNNFCATSKDDE